MAPKQTKFNLKWLDPSAYPDFVEWLTVVKDDETKAFCKACCKSIELSNLGKGTVLVHARGLSHKKFTKASASQPSISNFLLNPSADKPNKKSILETGKGITEFGHSPSHEECLFNKGGSAVGERQTSIVPFMSKELVWKSEILWALTVVETNMSFSSCAKTSKRLKKMFPDSAIAQQFQLSRTKASYIISYGLSFHFKELLFDELKECNDVTIFFDESLNNVVQKGQMDVWVRYWNDDDGTRTRYLNSVYLHRATSDDLLEKFLHAISGLPLNKVVQVSMDGPNVNLSFLRKLEEHLDTIYPNGKELLNLGTCGLHTLHGTFKTGLNSVDWGILSILRNLYYLFKDSPARRGEYLHITNSEIFPKKFCAIRWLTNSECLCRALEIIDNVKKYLSEGKLKTSKVSQFLKSALVDPLLKCKLAFVNSVVTQLEPFLRRFQTAKPMTPFLYEDLLNILLQLMQRFMKREKLDNLSLRVLLKLDLEAKDILLHATKVDIGFSARKLLKNVKVNELAKLSFYNDCKKILQQTVKKFIEKSPLKYKLVVYLSSLNPSVMLEKQNCGLKNFKLLLEELHAANRINESDAENAIRQYDSFCQEVKKYHLEHFQTYIAENHDEVGLDKFFGKYLDKKHTSLWKVMKICFILSHGNATVESGFSVNKNLLVENMHEDSIIAQRRVYDAIMSVGGNAENIIIDRRMIMSVRVARQRYIVDLDRKKQERKQAATQIQQKQKLEHELNDLQVRKKKLQMEKNKEEEEINSKLQLLKEKISMK